LIEDGSHVYHIYAIRLQKADRDSVMKKMQEKGVGASVHYPIPIHLQEAYSFLNHKKGDFPLSEKYAEQMLSLPIYPEITLEQQERVIETLKECL